MSLSQCHTVSRKSLCGILNVEAAKCDGPVSTANEATIEGTSPGIEQRGIISLGMVFIRHRGLVELEVRTKETFKAFNHILDIGSGRNGKGDIFSFPGIVQRVNISTKIVFGFTDAL